MLSCHSCQQLVPESDANESMHCSRCGAALHTRKHNSETRTWALIFTAAMLFIPANLYPIMTVSRFGQGEPDTIVSGVIHLVEGGMWPLALLVFFASIMVPLLKLAVLTFLLVSLKRLPDWRPRDRTLLFRATEVIGAWSMVDIFLIAILTALVKFDSFATIVPGPGANFFAAVVVTTLLAANSFDSRLIWDNCESNR